MLENFHPSVEKFSNVVFEKETPKICLRTYIFKIPFEKKWKKRVKTLEKPFIYM